MTLALFPAYGLARFVVSRPAALLAALGATMIPAFVVHVDARRGAARVLRGRRSRLYLACALVRRAGSRWTFAAAVAAALVAPLLPRRARRGAARSSLGVRAIVAWGSARASCVRAGTGHPRRLRRRRGLLVVGAYCRQRARLGPLGRVGQRRRAFPGAPARVRRLGRRRVHDRDRGPARRRRADRALASPGEPDSARARRRSASCSGSRSSASAATPPARRPYLSTIFADRVDERNLIYLAPLSSRPRRSRSSNAGSALAALAVSPRSSVYLLTTTPYNMDHFLLRRAGPGHPRAREQRLRLDARACPDRPALDARRRGRGRSGRRPPSRARVSLAIAIAAVVLTLGWTMTGEVNAARGSTAFRATI